ncbi:Inactive leucine-rich repeat receptor-like protein kinase coryne [Thalictrum thalictroides]|uniref:Inactive leucine-rich repeat receptor-like protein kinase coryne n=1 Tax=Thalictrum thalictroides TaxID=46969 RepID=A0A7J6UTL6_THATH|nr:Inactive leucine-rich repeat receptor-like protein kinase coryne [Thalictrum thalictroides]
METISKNLTLTVIFFFLLNLLYEGETRTESQHILAQSPSSSPSSKVTHLNIRLRRIIVGVLFGCLTGLISAILFAFLIRLVLRYMNRTPILKGPIIFSPKIASTTLQLALSNENQLLGSSSNGKYYRIVLDNGLTIAVKRLEPFDNGAQET